MKSIPMATAPKTAIWPVVGARGSMKGGRITTKNNKALGLKSWTMSPSRNAIPRPAGRAPDASPSPFQAESKARAPSQKM